MLIHKPQSCSPTASPSVPRSPSVSPSFTINKEHRKRLLNHAASNLNSPLLLNESINSECVSATVGLLLFVVSLSAVVVVFVAVVAVFVAVVVFVVVVVVVVVVAVVGVAMVVLADIVLHISKVMNKRWSATYTAGEGNTIGNVLSGGLPCLSLSSASPCS